MELYCRQPAGGHASTSVNVPLSCCPAGRRACGTFTLFHFLGDFQGQLEGGAWNVLQLQTFPQLGSPGTTGPLSTLKKGPGPLDLLRLWFWRSDDQGLFPVLLTGSRGSLHPSEAVHVPDCVLRSCDTALLSQGSEEPVSIRRNVMELPRGFGVPSSAGVFSSVEPPLPVYLSHARFPAGWRGGRGHRPCLDTSPSWRLCCVHLELLKRLHQPSFNSQTNELLYEGSSWPKGRKHSSQTVMMSRGAC